MRTAIASVCFLGLTLSLSTWPVGGAAAGAPPRDELERFVDWIELTIETSRSTSAAAIIVDKAEYRLYLLLGGRLHGSYPVELGFNPVDDKTREGDGCTPEGMYRVI